MASSGTYAFTLTGENIVTEAAERCQLNPEIIDGDFAVSCRRSLNLMFLEWAADGLHLWTLELLTFALVAGTHDYTLPVGTIDVIDANRYSVDGGGNAVEYPMAPLGRSDYFALTNKETPGPPNQFWTERILPRPVLHVYPTPEAGTTDIVRYFRLRQLQDFSASTETADVPVPWLPSVCAGLAAKIAEKFVKDKDLRAEIRSSYVATYKLISGNDRERVSMTARPSWDPDRAA